MKHLDLPQLIARGSALRAGIAAQTKELKELEAQILTHGPGKHEGPDGTFCRVVEQSPGETTYVLPAAKEEQAREVVGSPDVWKKLFTRVVSFDPCDAFAAVVPKLLTPAKSRDLLALCAKPGAAGKTYVKWS